MKKILFILSIMTSSFSMSQTIDWANPEEILVVNYKSSTWKSYSIILYYHNDSIKELAVLGTYVGEKFKEINSLSLEQFLENISKNIAICDPCIVQDGDLYVKVSSSKTKPIENTPAITINILFENVNNIKKWTLNQSAQFGYFDFNYKDYQFKKI